MITSLELIAAGAVRRVMVGHLVLQRADGTPLAELDLRDVRDALDAILAERDRGQQQ